ncbi:MAG TPA: sodium:calcium antiporter [Actinomycetota bacterium]|jgi:cation:H+ antiporter|nr:sodium:calcium antiporter [Actinomycetota bacterium]
MATARPTLLRPSFLLALLSPLPGLAARMSIIHAPLLVETLFFGLAILGAAFLLSWAAEVAQLDISQTLAIAVLALIAVLPEYAVDLVLAYRGGQGDEESRHLAVANMTGANRLLIGIGWATVVLVFWAKARRRKVELRREQRTDVGFLLVATLWAFTIPIRGQLSLLDLAVLGILFVAYIIRAAREEVEEPDLIGAAGALGALPRIPRRVTTVLLFLYSASAILLVAEPFAEGLKEIGTEFGISRFLLIQWVAPLASEAPEMIIAILFTLRLKAQAGLGTLISSKVNQWTLLVGTLPLVYGIAGGGGGGFFTPMRMDARQIEEVFLTAAQSLFAVAVIANLAIGRAEAIGLLVLFFGQFAVPVPAVRIGFGILYIALAVGIFLFDASSRRDLGRSILYVFRPGRRRAMNEAG